MLLKELRHFAPKKSSSETEIINKTVWNTNDEKILESGQNQELLETPLPLKKKGNIKKCDREPLTLKKKWPKLGYLSSLVFHTVLLTKSGLYRDIFTFSKIF